MLYTHIQRLCNDRGLTITDLSHLTGISHHTINQWDYVVPREKSVAKVAEVLHVSLESLLAKVEGKTRKCDYCGKEFVLKTGMTSRVKFCSPECRNASKAKKKREKEMSSFAIKTEKAREMKVDYGMYVAIRDGYIKGGKRKCQEFPKTHTTSFIPVRVVLTDQ